MKERTIKQSLVPAVIKLLRKDNVAFEIKTVGDGEMKCLTNLSSGEYHDYVLKAMCELQRAKKKTKVLSYNDLTKRGVTARGNFISLSKDREKMLEIC